MKVLRPIRIESTFPASINLSRCRGEMDKNSAAVEIGHGDPSGLSAVSEGVFGLAPG